MAAGEVIVLGKDGESVKNGLERHLTDLRDRIVAAEAKGEDINTMRSGLAALDETVKTLNTRFAAGRKVDGIWRAPFSARELAKAKWNTVHKAVTKVERVADRHGKLAGWSDNDHPVAVFQEACDNLVSEIMVRGIQGDRNAVRDLTQYEDSYLPALREVHAFLKANEAFDTAQAGMGLEWIPNEYSTRWFEKVRLESNVWSFFETVPMPRSPYNYPTILADLVGYLIPETVDSTQPAGTKIGNAGELAGITGKCVLTAKGIGGFVVYSKYVEEDAILAMSQQLPRLLVISVARAVDDAVINGDATGAHQDTDVAALPATDRRKAWDGLRMIGLSLAESKLTASNTAITTAALWATSIAALRGKMGIYGVHANRLGMIVGPKFFNQIINVPDFRTLYAFGAAATALNVDIGTLRPDGMTLMVSEFMREDLNALGVQDGVTTTRSAAILVHQDAWKGGTLRSVTLQVLKEVFALWDQDAIVATSRMAFAQALAQSATRVHTAILYDTYAA